MDINERVKELRKHEGLTLEKLGERIGLTKGTLSGIEKGRSSVTDRLVMMLVKEFGVSEKWLRTGEGEMFPPPSERDRLAILVSRMLRSRDDAERQYITEFLYNKMNDDELHLLMDRIIEFVDGLKDIRESQD